MTSLSVTVAMAGKLALPDRPLGTGAGHQGPLSTPQVPRGPTWRVQPGPGPERQEPRLGFSVPDVDGVSDVRQSVTTWSSAVPSRVPSPAPPNRRHRRRA